MNAPGTFCRVSHVFNKMPRSRQGFGRHTDKRDDKSSGSNTCQQTRTSPGPDNIDIDPTNKMPLTAIQI